MNGLVILARRRAVAVRVLLLLGGLVHGAMPAVGRPLSFEEALALALANSPQLQASQAEFQAQEARTTASWLDLGPRLSAAYNQVYFENKMTAVMPTPAGPVEMLMRDKESRTGSLTLVQPLTGLFALHQKARFEASQGELKALTLEEARTQVAFQAAEAYLNAQQAEKMLGIASSRVEAVRAQQRDGDALLQAGRIHRGDFLKLQLAFSQAQSDLAKATAGREVALFTLLEITGLKGGQAAEIPALQVPTALPQQELPALEQAMSQALATNLQVAQVSKGHEIASFGKKLAYARFSPSVNLFAKLDRNFGEASFGGEAQTKSYGLQLTWDIWDNGSRFYQMSEANHLISQADAAVVGIQQKIRIEVAAALAFLKASQESYSLASAAKAQAFEAYRIEKAKFSSGKSTATELIISESAQAGAEGGEVAAYTELLLQNFKLQRALGSKTPQLL